MTNLASWRRRLRASTCRKSTRSVADTSRQKAPRGTHLLKTAQKFAGVHCGRQWDLGQVPLLLQTRPRHQLRLLQRHVGHGLVGVSARKNKTSSKIKPLRQVLQRAPGSQPSHQAVLPGARSANQQEGPRTRDDAKCSLLRLWHLFYGSARIGNLPCRWNLVATEDFVLASLNRGSFQDNNIGKEAGTPAVQLKSQELLFGSFYQI